MEDELKIKMYSFTVDCKDPYELAKFHFTVRNMHVSACRERRRGDTPVLHSNKTQSMNRPYGRKGRECSSKWRIWTLP